MSASDSFVNVPAPLTARGASTRISTDPKGERLLYVNGRNVVIRSIASPHEGSTYAEHTTAVTAASWSPSGYYIASGDAVGNVRIWDATQKEHILKLQTRPISGKVTDIAWDAESKRLIVVGDGKDKFGHAFLIDTASSVGEISGVSKIINAASIRPVRPFRAVTCSDDMSVSFYHGPPFKFQKSLKDHSRFVQDVRYSPDGKYFVSVGLDFKIFVYHGETGDLAGEVTDAPHTGGIFAVSWSPDSASFATVSADATCKIWAAEARTLTKEVRLAGAAASPASLDDQQVGVVWTRANVIIALSLGGELRYIDPQSGAVTRSVSGHQRGITALARAGSSGALVSGAFDGRAMLWTGANCVPQRLTGNGHTSQVIAIAAPAGSSNKRLFSVGMDDTVREIDLASNTFTGKIVSTGALPVGVAAHESGTVCVATLSSLLILDGATMGVTATVDLSAGGWKPTAVAISADGREVAVGGDDCKVRFFALPGGAAIADRSVTQRGAITTISYNAALPLLAVGDANRQITVYDAATLAPQISQWVFHNAKVESFAWSPSGKRAASGSLDTNIEVWSVDAPSRHITIKNAHSDSVTGIAWTDEENIVSAGKDGCVRGWTIKHHAA